MSNIIQFPSTHKNARELPFLRLHDSLPELIEKTIELGLLASCSLTYRDDELSLYLVVVQLPSGRQAHFEQPENELKNFLNGLYLGYIMQKKTGGEG